MSKINLNPVRLFTDDDIYETDVDNRPILDLSSNIDLINEQLDKLGFFIELKAGPDEEPAGGFSINTCGYIGSNSLLYPINISKSISETDYSKFPIVLITGYNQDLRTYKCLAFSAFYKITDRFQSFLPTSVGNLLKVGPGGQLIDEFFFNQYYSGKGYQHLIVGKIASVKEISFGGNQINVFGDSTFLTKNHDDSTSGLITVSRNNKDSNVVFKSVGIDSVNSPYLFSEFQCSFKPEFISAATIPTPLFFTHSPLNYNQITGTILDANIDSKLNELHFKSPEISINTSSDKIYESLGVTINSLLKFSSANLLHSAPYSSASSEFSQSISTNLNFNFSTTSQTQLIATFPSIKKSIGNGLNVATGLPTELLPAAEPISGVVFGDYTSNGFGAIIESVTDDALLSVGRPSVQSESDSQILGEFTTTKISTQQNGQTLLIHSKSNITGLSSSIALVSDSHIVLSAKNGVHVNKTPELDSEVVNKGYLTQILSDVTEISNKIPLSGTETDNPITGKLVFDLTRYSTTTAFNIVSNSTADLASASMFRLIETSDTNNLQRILFKTDDTIDPMSVSWKGTEGVNKDFLKLYVDDAVIPDASSYVTKATDQEITGIKSFTEDIILESSINFTGNIIPTINSYSGCIDFISKLRAITPSPDDLVDSVNTVVNKEYVNSVKVDTIEQVKNVWANWSQSPSISTGMMANKPPTSKSNLWDSYISTASGDAFSILNDCVVNLNLSVNLRLTEYLMSINLIKIPISDPLTSEVVASSSAGTSTSAAGFVTGNYSMNINAQVVCESGDILKFVIVSQTPAKSVGSLLDSSNYGFASIIRL